MLDIHQSNAGLMMVSQHCANICPLNKTLLTQHGLANVRPMFLLILVQRWPNVGVLSGNSGASCPFGVLGKVFTTTGERPLQQCNRGLILVGPPSVHFSIVTFHASQEDYA